MARRKVSFPESPDSATLLAALAAGADPNAVDDFGTPYLSCFAGEGQAELVRILLDHGANPCPPDGASLVVALMRGHFDIAELLVARGASVEHGANGRTALTHVMCYGEPPAEVVAWLLAHGAKPGADSEGTFPLFEAAREGWTEVVRQLLAAGVQVNEGPIIDFGFGVPTQDSPLGVAKHYRRKAIVAMLAAAGAKKELPAPSLAKRVTGDPTLQLGIALWEDDRAFIAELLAAGADPNGATTSKEPFLAAAMRLRKRDYVELLLGAGANANTLEEGKKGAPVLHQALSTASTADKPADFEAALGLVELLLAHGADPNLLHKKAGVAIHILRPDKPDRRGRLARLLLGHGLDVDARIEKSTLLFELAARADDAELFAELLERGAKTEGKVNGLTLGERVRYASGKAKKKLAALLEARGIAV